MVGLEKKRHFFEAKNLKLFPLFSGIEIIGKLIKQKFYACARAEKSDITARFRVHSVVQFKSL